jgi:hypothetical protein
MPSIHRKSPPPLHVELIGGPLDGQLIDGAQVPLVAGFLPDSIARTWKQAEYHWSVVYLIDTKRPTTPRGARRFVYQAAL